MAAWTIPSDKAIRELLIQRLDVERQGVGIVVGVIDERGRRIVAHGTAGASVDHPLDAETVFEIGSITKVVTALLLTDMAARGEVALDDPVGRLLPAGVTMPTRGDREIDLTHLAMHRSGLPRWPTDLDRSDWVNPYASYTVEALHDFLSRYRLRRDIGSSHLYSNLGVGLLGHVLALRSGVDWETVVRQRITGPLGMPDTAVALSTDLAARLAIGHDHDGVPVANWDMPTFAGAGALRSTAGDLLTFLAAALGYIETPLADAMAAQRIPRLPSDSDYVQALGWRIAPDPEGEIVWHGGATGGYRCFALFVPARRAGVVVLANSASIRNDDIGFHLVSGRPLAPAAPATGAVHLDAEVLARFVGRYRFSPGRHLAVTAEGRRLFAQITGQPRFEVFAHSPSAFVWRVAPAEMAFEIGGDGDVTGLVLRQSGREYPATRETD